MNQQTRNDMQNTVGAVRDYANNASEKEKTDKSGQQKWGLFETNYQRNKGITTDQSLQEIEVCLSALNKHFPNLLSNVSKNYYLINKEI